MNLNLKKKTALITGSTSGIGKAIAMSLASEGVSVIINGRNQTMIDKTVREIEQTIPNAQVQGIAADLGTREGCELVIARFPNIDILINNLGIYEPVEYFDTQDADWYQQFEVNIMSSIRLTRYYLKQMIATNQGRIIFIGSEAALVPALELPHYSAVKTMQLSLSRSLAELTKGTEVTVNTITPGSTLTDGVKEMLQSLYQDTNMTLEEMEQQFVRENRATSIIQRLILPEEIANLVTFVSSPLSSAINGSALKIDGGIVRTIF
jgi:3-oxoacyl-[acyl-carrier protein] reductase